MPQGHGPFDQIFSDAFGTRLESIARWSRRALIVLAVVLALALAACYWWFHPALNLGSQQVWTWICGIALLAILVLAVAAVGLVVYLFGELRQSFF